MSPDPALTVRWRPPDQVGRCCVCDMLTTCVVLVGDVAVILCGVHATARWAAHFAAQARTFST